MATQVWDNAAASRYELSVDGQYAGRLTYVMREGRCVLDATKVARGFQGRGLASILVRAALDDRRARGDLVVPVCPFVVSWLDQHPDYADLVDREMLDRVGTTGDP